jgi:hypothetical protein
MLRVLRSQASLRRIHTAAAQEALKHLHITLEKRNRGHKLFLEAADEMFTSLKPVFIHQPRYIHALSLMLEPVSKVQMSQSFWNLVVKRYVQTECGGSWDSPFCLHCVLRNDKSCFACHGSTIREDLM